MRRVSASQRSHWVAGRTVLLSLVLAAGLAGVGSATADGPPGETFVPGSDLRKVTATAQVESKSDGIYVHISVRGTGDGDHGNPQPAVAVAPAARASSPSVPSSPPAPSGTSWTDDFGYHYRSADGSHTQDILPENFSSVSQDFWHQQFAEHPNQSPYNLVVDQQYQGFVWLPNQPGTAVYVGPDPQAPPDTPPAGNGGSTDPYQVALDVLTHIPLPTIQLEQNPGLGLVAMPGWFWVQGYDGRTFGASKTVTLPPAFPGGPPRSFTVTVRVWGNKYIWNFGDGTSPLSGSLGKAYPQESDVKHTYEFSSFGLSSGFELLLTVEFAAQFQVNGGAPQGLPPIQHTYRANYPVQEVQSTLSAPQKP